MDQSLISAATIFLIGWGLVAFSILIGGCIIAVWLLKSYWDGQANERKNRIEDPYGTRLARQLTDAEKRQQDYKADQFTLGVYTGLKMASDNYKELKPSIHARCNP